MTAAQVRQMYLNEAKEFRTRARWLLAECAATRDMRRRRELAQLAAADLHLAAQCRKDAGRFRAA